MILSACAFLVFSLQPLLQDPAPKPEDKRPEVAGMLDKLKAHVDKEGKEDKDAIAVLDSLIQEFKNSGPKDRAAIVKGVSHCFEARRLEEKGDPNNQLYMAAAVT